MVLVDKLYRLLVFKYTLIIGIIFGIIFSFSLLPAKTVFAEANLVGSYDFNNSLIDTLGVTTLSTLPTNTTSGFGTSVGVSDPSFWFWTSTPKTNGGGGFSIDIPQNSFSSSDYSIGLRFAFNVLDAGYNKIIDYKNRDSDNGFYFLGNKIMFYPGSGSGDTTINPGDILDMVVTRNGTTKLFTVYFVVNGTRTKEFEYVDTNNYAVGYTTPDNKVRFGFFHDDRAQLSETTTDGKVYSIKLWNGAVGESAISQAMNPKYLVTFNDNVVGVDITMPSVQEVENGGKVTQPTNPTRTNYSFGGWYTTSGLTTPWDFDNDTISQNTTLYAKWTTSFLTLNSSTTTNSATISIGTTITSGEHSIVLDWDHSLVGWWRFNSVGDTASHSSNNINVVNNGATWVSTGKYAGAYSFNGSSNYLDLGIPVSAQSQNNLTLSAWIKTTDVSGGYKDIIANQWQYGESGIMMTIQGASTIHVPFSTATGQIDTLDATATTTDGNWHLVTVTFDSGTVKIYVDGTEKASKTSSIVTSIAYNNSNHLLIGKDSASGGTEHFNGSIDDIQIYNRTLSSPEILSLYNGDVSPYSRTFTSLVADTYPCDAYSQETDGIITTSSSNVIILPANYTLSYSASANGSLSGNLSQTVSSGSSGSAVVTSANAHYHFVNWSDGSTATPRIDTNVSQNIGVTANFAIDTYTVTYSAGSHGSITGVASQTINYGADSSSVTSNPDSGYHFTNWSDGNTQNPRQIIGVTANHSFTANFVADDVDAPVISSVGATVSDTQATVTWTTNEPTSSRVQYGLNQNYGFITDETDTSSRLTNHVIALSTLKPCARYFYRVISVDATNNQSASAQKTFNTLGCATSLITTGTETTLPTTGGTVQLVNSLSTAQLNVPDNYSHETATFQINKLDMTQAPVAPLGKSIATNNFYDLIAVTQSNEQITTFTNPVTFTISYGSDTEADYVESTLDVYKYDGTNWIKKNCTLDAIANILTCSLSGFSAYAVLGDNTVTTNTNNSSSGSSSGSSACSSQAPLLIPDLFQINSTPTTAKLFFTPIDYNQFYISFSTNPDAEMHGEFVTLTREGVQSETIFLLKPNTTYYVKVRGQNGCMAGKWSNIMKFKTDSQIYYKNFSPKTFSKIITTPEVINIIETVESTPTPTFDNHSIDEPVKSTQSPPSKKCFLWWCW